MTELSFLIQLILDEELPAKHKKICAERIKEIESNFSNQPQLNPQSYPPNPPSYPQVRVQEPVVPSSAAAAQALQARAEAISKAGKIEPGRTSARKF